MPGFVKPCWIASPTERISSKPELNRIAFDGLSRGRRKEPKHSRKRAVEMPTRGKHGKPTSAFPPFPPSLNIPQHRRDAHIPTAPTIHPYIRSGSKPCPKPQSRVGQIKFPKWAKCTCQKQIIAKN